ncbi:MAG: hypothetical protein AVDCRST_MAG91-1556 [uncultured Sphingomonadaceae bacterium]|uniref:Uncharacterized protein n=1 Tax=uncultured Sphingomonadaceae bacterium TaxID=169976 RepID=A0A6J4SZA7_9SPHN|nr:MAG: hypothetical protein AVDCRST_MAG91-1556 [uncultured Sphingomonadaceae bacterium]
MGFSGRFVYSEGAWRDDPGDEPFLAIDIHDSDIATVDFHSAAAAGRFYLGFQPRDYWEDPDASEPVDADAEAASLSAWVKDVLDLSVEPTEIRPLLAEDGVEDPKDDFVEETAARLIQLLRLSLPDDLPAPP